MFRTICLTTLIACLVSTAALGQDVKKSDIKGVIVDENEGPLESATLMLLNATDSVLVGFTTTETDGGFKMPNVKAGEYLVKVNYLGYAPLFVDVAAGTSAEIDLGNLQMELAAEVLGEVEVTADHVPLEIKKDTISYNADAFQTQPNAAVEDLLKKLPGVEVDQDGNIKAQGEDVQNVFVDGKEFFGTDPKIATKNLPADAVDRVEVYDRKSEMAEFSGIDDGEREKTINLRLKEDKKQGVFGNVEAGYGTEDRFNAKASINRFSKKSQLSFLGMANNINEQGFSINEFLNFSGGMSNLMRGGGRMRIGGGNSTVPINQGMSNGLAQTLAGGLNYNVEIGKKVDLRTNYFFNGIDNEITQDIFRQDFVNDTLGNSGTIETLTASDSETRNNGHRANVNMEWDIDSTQQLEIRTTGSYSSGDYDQFENVETYDVDHVLTNTNVSDYFNENDNWSFDGNAFYRKRFGQKKGRTLTLNGSYNINNSNGDGRLMSLTEFLKTGDVTMLDQVQDDTGENTRWGARASYTEPVGVNKWLEVNYQYQNNENLSDKSFYDVDTITGDEIFNPVLSNFYTRDFVYHRIGSSFKWNTNKSSLNIGLQYQDSDLEGFINDNENPIKKQFGAILPSVRWRYDLATARNLRFDYTTSISVPSVQQLSPIVDNSNPLQIYIGNPDLKQEYSHRASLHFHSFSQFSSTSLFAMLRTTYTQDKIVNSTFINQNLQQVTSPVNIDNDLNVMFYGSFSRPLKFMKSRIRLNARTTYINSQENINRILQDLNRWNNTLGMSFQSLNSDVFEYTLGGDWTFSNTNYKSNSAIDQSYFIQHYYTDITVNFLKNWSVSTSFDVRFYSGDQFQGDETLPLWKASLSRYIFKDRRGEIRLSMFDVLDENRGISRSSDANYLEEIKSNSLGRYVMLSFVYSIKGFNQGQVDVPHWMSRRR